jgi:hypothetical protein
MCRCGIQNSKSSGIYIVSPQPYWGLGRPIPEFSRSHSDTPQSVGLLWTSDQPRRRDLHLTTRDVYKRHTSMPPVRYEPEIPASERPQTYEFDIATTGIGPFWHVFVCRNILVPLSEVCGKLNVLELL